MGPTPKRYVTEYSGVPAALIDRAGRRDRASSPQAVAGEIDAVGVVDEAVEDGVGSLRWGRLVCGFDCQVAFLLGQSVATVAARRVDVLQRLEVEFDDGVQLVCQRGAFEVRR
jgi:hypothetical protein